MKACVRHWKVYYGGFWHHFLDFRRHPLARLRWRYDCVVELVRTEPHVRRTHWEQILEEANGAKPVLVREVTTNLDQIFQRTERKLYWPTYNVVFYNCEHFANECMIGRRRSRQVRIRTSQVITAASSGVCGVWLMDHQAMSETIPWLAIAILGIAFVFATIFASFVFRSIVTIRRMGRRRRRAAEASVKPAVA